jgi:hypothetical protein
MIITEIITEKCLLANIVFPSAVLHFEDGFQSWFYCYRVYTVAGTLTLVHYRISRFMISLSATIV